MPTLRISFTGSVKYEKVHEIMRSCCNICKDILIFLPIIFTFLLTLKLLLLAGLNDETWYTEAVGSVITRQTVVKLPLDSLTQVQS